MTKMFKNSDDAVIDELSIFSTPATNTSVRDTYFIETSTSSSLTDETLVFQLENNDTKYYDLARTQLLMECVINGTSGTPSETDTAFAINHLLQSMWKYVEVWVGDKLISHGSDHYPQKSYFKTLSHRMRDAGDLNTLKSELFYADDGTFDKTSDSVGGANAGYIYRSRYSWMGKTFEMVGQLNECSLNLNKYLINGVKVKIKLHRAPDKFTIMSNNEALNWKLVIKSARMRFCALEVGPSIIAGHDHGLNSKGKALYFFNQCHISSINMSQGDKTLSKNVFTDQIPHRIYVAFSDASRILGDYEKNPLYFYHYNVSQVKLVLNNQVIPAEGYNTDFNGGKFMMAYYDFMRLCPNYVMTPEKFKNGYTIFPFDLTPSEPDDSHLLLQKIGSVRLDLKFDTPLPHQIEVLVYAEFQNCFTVDHVRTVDFTPLKT